MCVERGPAAAVVLQAVALQCEAVLQLGREEGDRPRLLSSLTHTRNTHMMSSAEFHSCSSRVPTRSTCIVQPLTGCSQKLSSLLALWYVAAQRSSHTCCDQNCCTRLQCKSQITASLTNRKEMSNVQTASVCCR